MLGLKTRRRNRVRRRPFPESWAGILRRNVPYSERLAPAEQAELRGHIQVILSEKSFEGCAGLELTDEILVTIAAYAGLLLLGRRQDFYPRLRSVLVYPEAYLAPVTRPGPGRLVVEGRELRLGESWRTGALIVSWNQELHGPFDPRTGHNVALHEFAHQLDQEDGAVNGAPLLPRTSRYADWSRTFSREYQRLMEDAAAGRPTVLDKYGATDPAEFFAVATECFFERPDELHVWHPELYQELRNYYRQDPAGAR